MTVFIARTAHTPSRAESEYLMGFLLTYRSFTTAFDLVEILKLRYVWVPANLKDKDEKSPEMDDFRKNRQLPIRIRYARAQICTHTHTALVIV